MTNTTSVIGETPETWNSRDLAMAALAKSNMQGELTANLHSLYEQRLARLRRVMHEMNVTTLLTIDPVNIFYATGARNMDLFTLRTPSRYHLLFAEGPSILFDYVGCEHLASGLPTIDEIRSAPGLGFIGANGNPKTANENFAKEIADTTREVVGEIGALAIGRFPFATTEALKEQGFALMDADEVFCPARAIKMPIELPYFWEAMRRVEQATLEMEQGIRAGRTENEIWADFHRAFIAQDGRYIYARLLQSGPRTYPYFQECGERVVQDGDLVCLDTDATAYEGYGVDFSRAFFCGDRKPTNVQKTLHGLAHEQLVWNSSLMKPGVSCREIAEHIWELPNERGLHRYSYIGHGLGLAEEFPTIQHMPTNAEKYPVDSIIEPGMVICMESYVASEHTSEGIKLEDQFLITDTGAERMSGYRFSDKLSR